MPEDRTLGYECPVCGNALRLDSGEGDSPRSVYCAECETDFPEILARLDGETAERVRLLPLLERCLAAVEISDSGPWPPMESPTTLRLKVAADLRRELGLPEEG